MKQPEDDARSSTQTRQHCQFRNQARETTRWKLLPFTKRMYNLYVAAPAWQFLSTFIQVLHTRPDCHCMRIMAWSLSGFPSGPTPVLHIFLVVLGFMQSHGPTPVNAGGPPLCS